MALHCSAAVLPAVLERTTREPEAITKASHTVERPYDRQPFTECGTMAWGSGFLDGSSTERQT